mgnify:CR=1 FL=1
MPPCRFAMALALAASLSPLVACGGADKSGGAATTAGKAAPAEIDAAGLKARMDAGKIALIDVRTPSEFADGHAPGAVNIPLDQLAQRMSELEAHKTGELYLICRSGARSGRAQGQLAAAGFTNPINVAGGTLAWRAAGFPVE